MTLLILFSLSLALVLYAYLLFPLLLLVRAAVWRRPVAAGDITPAVSMLIACHNEADSIEAKLRNCLSLDYPAGQLEIIVASDGSSDATPAIVARVAAEDVSEGRITLLTLPRGGKAAALNAAATRAAGEVLVFSDANSMFAADAIRELTRPLADARVGGVAGDQRYLAEPHGAVSHAGERSYWSYDRLLKRAQSRAGSVTSATGAIYCIRRSLFQPIPAAVTDDFVTSARVVAQGYRLVFAPRAVAFEQLAGSGDAEFRRKVRLMTRGLLGVVVLRQLLNPIRHGFYAWQLFSHKVLRRLVFLGLAGCLASSLLLWPQGLVFQVLAGVQLFFYGCAGIGLISGRRAGRIKLFSVPAYFVMANAAAALATWNLLRGRRIEIWQPSRNDLTRATPGVA